MDINQTNTTVRRCRTFYAEIFFYYSININCSRPESDKEDWGRKCFDD